MKTKPTSFLMNSFSKVFLIFGFLSSNIQGFCQQTDTVRTFKFSDTRRVGDFMFPVDTNIKYSKIKMLYRMRCKNAQVSTGSNRNLGCGEWDYSCNTYITDSTKTDSLKASQADHIITGFSAGNFPFSYLPTKTFTEYYQKQTNVQATLDETVFSINSGTANISEPFSSQSGNRKIQFLWTAQELIQSGLSAGPIHGMRLNITQGQAILSGLRIRIKQSSKLNLTEIEDTTGFKQAFFRTININQTGETNFQFYTPFIWNGSSGIILECSYSNGINMPEVKVMGQETSAPACISNSTNDGFAEFDGFSSGIDLGDINSLDSAQKFTFEAWVNIREWKNWTGIFKDNGKTVLETGDTPGQLYCIIRNPDNTYGFAANVLPLKTWTHVGMVFDGTQADNINRLKLFINGVQRTLTFSGNIPSHTENNKTPLILAQGVACSLDAPRVWNTPLNGQTISSWMKRKIRPNHPFYSSLEFEGHLDENNGSIVSDSSSFQRNGVLFGNAKRRVFNGIDLFKNLEPVLVRPNIKWFKGTYTQTNTDIPVLDSITDLPKTVVRYKILNDKPVATDTLLLYHATNQKVLNEAGALIRNIPAIPDSTIQIQTLNYYQKFPQKFELMSFVTPYGIGINFGTQGKVWEFDVTDFQNQLRGMKRISLERGGEFQEEMDIRFVFYRGNPARKVLSLTQLWPVTQSGYTDILQDKVFEPRTLKMNPLASSFKIRTVITGHGQEGEFIPRTHWLNINGGSPEYQWDVWTPCATNPVFPQGGTWVYDRAGWCPGAPSDIKEWKPNSLLQAGALATFDYGLNTAAGDSRYIVNHQLVQYGPTILTYDAGISDITSPSDRIEFFRRNPSCMNPVVRLTNQGTANINALQINFGLEGGAVNTLNWSGNLASFTSTDITLDLPYMGKTQGVFKVWCSSPNGQSDQNVNNDTLRSVYAAPLDLPSKFVLEFKSNLRPQENSYELRTADGTPILIQNGFSTNTIYRDTLDLPDGCYEFHFLDEGNDGLNWWANTAQGSGYIRIKKHTTGAIIRTFNPDFGGEVFQHFVVTPFVSVEKPIEIISGLDLYPNPANGRIQVSFGMTRASELEIEVIDLLGKKHLEKSLGEGIHEDLNLDVSKLSKGIYLLLVKSEGQTKVKKFVKN